MPSPFPGMDPYIEACGLWEDFHGTLIHEIKSALAQATPERYVVRTGVRSYLVLVDEHGKENHPFPPNVSVSSPRGKRKSPKKSGIVVAEPAAEAEPLTLRAFVEEEHRESFVEIYETDPEQRLVTCLEVLSPSNKRPGTPGWDLYQRKRQSLLLGDVNLVEIDLLRGGERMPMLDSWPESPYVLMVAKAKSPQLCKAWPTHSLRPLSPIPVPLAKPDPAIPLSLQPIIDGIYQRYRYERSIDYKKPLAPALSPEEAAWLETQLRATGKPRGR